MNAKKYVSLIMALATVGSLALAVPAFAVSNQQGGNNNSEQGQVPTLTGTVSAISGATITLAVPRDLVGVLTTVNFTVNATNATVTKNGVTNTVSSIAVGDNVVVRGTITGTNIVATTIRVVQNNQGEGDSNRMNPIVVGKVSVINGKILTVISQQETNNTATTFTVDATNAKLLRGNTTIKLSDITVGDNVVVQGTLTGTNVVATLIRDGKVGNGNGSDNNQALLQIQGNGQPIIAGTISAINGSVLTVTNTNAVYSVDAANAKIVQGKNTISLSGVKTGDSVVVQGTVNGTSATASTIPVTASTIIDSNATTHLGFFASIGQWFKHLFRF